jgi:L-serine dehydratase
MSIDLYPDFFNDVFGPIMQAGSSSHLGGPSRLGQLTRYLLDETPTRVEVIMDTEGSFAGTFGAMSEDEGMLSGSLGIPLDDPRRSSCYALAEEHGTEVAFTKSVMSESEHINALKYVLTGTDGRMVTLVGDSTGGGMVETKVINGFPYRFKGDTNLAMVIAPPGNTIDEDEVLATLSAIVHHDVVVHEQLGSALFVQSGDEIDRDAVRSAAGETNHVFFTRSILPTVTRPDKKPQLFDTVTEWRAICEREDKTMYEVAIDYEIAASGLTREEIEERFRHIGSLMRRQVAAPFEEDVDLSEHPYGMTPFHQQWDAHLKSGKSLTAGYMGNAMRDYWASMAMPVGIPVVPGPHGAGGGVIAAAIRTAINTFDFTEDDVIRGLTIAAMFGAITYTRAEPTGETMGCTGEMGISGVLASAALCEMAGGTPEQVEDAATWFLMQAYGIPCDPMIGGETMPCNSRGMMAVILPIVCADTALAGRSAMLPYHEVLDVAWTVGSALSPDLLCTSRGGAAATPTAVILRKKAAEASPAGMEFHEHMNEVPARRVRPYKCT